MWNFKANYRNSDSFAGNHFFDSFSNLFSKLKQALIFLIFQIENIICFFFRNYQGMSFCKRINIQKSVIMVILSNFIGRNFTIYNF